MKVVVKIKYLLISLPIEVVAQAPLTTLGQKIAMLKVLRRERNPGGINCSKSIGRKSLGLSSFANIIFDGFYDDSILQNCTGMW